MLISSPLGHSPRGKTLTDSYFRALCYDLNLNYTLPDRNDLSEEILPKLYKNTMKTVKEESNEI